MARGVPWPPWREVEAELRSYENMQSSQPMNDSDSSGQDQEPLARGAVPPEGGATAAAPPEPLSSSMHQEEEPGQPLATTSEGGATAAAAVHDPQQEDGNELEVGASGDESQEERQGTGSETEELEFMRQV